LIQVFSQVNRVYSPGTQAWSSHLSVFVQASSSEGTKVFDRLHLIHDDQNLVVSLSKDQWSVVERPGEFWVGTNDLVFPGGEVPLGTWRVLLVTRSGQRLESTFAVPPPQPGTPEARTFALKVSPDSQTPGRFLASGWVDDYLVWSRDPRGNITTRTRTVGPSFSVSPDTDSFLLYSYDKNRGEGLVAGPFLVQDLVHSADR